jgi:hypothetical protein
MNYELRKLGEVVIEERSNPDSYFYRACIPKGYFVISFIIHNS